MRKNFPLTIEGRHRDRVLDAVKHEIRKYLQRERRRPVPEGAQFWDFDCRFGLTQDLAEPVAESAIKPRLDAAAQEGAASVYVEILSKPGFRAPRPAETPAPE
jgi:hypothetical protein